MTPRTFLVPALLVPALLAMESHGDAPTFAPEAGSSLTKRFETQVDISLDDSEMVVNGEEQSMPMESETHVTTTIAFTDRYDAVGDGRATKLTRSFDELSSETTGSQTGPMGSNDVDVSGQSDLEGESVVFSWDEDAEEYDAAFDEESSGDDELLEGLVADTDFTAFLPDGDVAEGDAWDVEPSAILGLIAPGGSLNITDDSAPAGTSPGGSGPSDLLEEFDGEIAATFAGLREEDGARLAVIELEIDVSSAVDMTEMMLEALSGSEDMPDGLEMDVESADMEFLFEGSGEIVWNLSAGIVYSARISGDVEQIIDQSMHISFGGQEQSMETSSTSTGTQTVTLATD